MSIQVCYSTQVVQLIQVMLETSKNVQQEVFMTKYPVLGSW